MVAERYIRYRLYVIVAARTSKGQLEIEMGKEFFVLSHAEQNICEANTPQGGTVERAEHINTVITPRNIKIGVLVYLREIIILARYVE